MTALRQGIIRLRESPDAAMAEAVVGQDMAGQRLDKAAALLVPGAGLRGRRRLIAAERLLVDGRVREAAYRVRVGEKLAVLPPPEAEGTVMTAAEIPVLARDAAYAALDKPAGLHSAALAHGGGQSLEALLPEIFPDCAVRLLSRLDRLTSGILPVAFTETAAVAYRRLEDGGAVAKTYLAVVHGAIAAPFVVTSRLDMADRAKTRVLALADPDPLRHTHVQPREVREGLTLVACRIAKGARHQIRAHLAASGHPLVGDPVYGAGEGTRLYLHCAALESPVLTIAQAPPWSLAAATRAVTGAAPENRAKCPLGKNG